MSKCRLPERKAHHTANLKTKLVHRMNRIEGQVRGIRKMIEEDVYCDDILTQIAAVKSAINAVAQNLFEAHLNSCIVEQIRSGSDEVMAELQETVKRMLK
ncbi:MAG TPA: metal-sensitive transcriptional regulator [Candidatus Syntrophosphaera sp.]|nr:metal-sensitive transcriptional regulator [Candidatus Syntrophosphaera sp.]